MLSDGTWTYTWEHGRQLASASNGTTSVSYEFNADGMRLSKTVGSTTTKYYYIGSELTYMTVGADTIGRFISADGFTSTGQGALGTNAYVYCGNNPVNFVDPTGTEFVSIAVVSLAAALGVSLISALVLLNATLEFQNSVKRVAVCYCTIKG